MDLKVLKCENVDQAPEILIYFWIETLGDFIHCIHRARTRPSGGDPEMFSAAVQADLDNAFADQKALVEMLKKRQGFAFADHEEYKRWYRWWNQWHKYSLSNERWEQLNSSLLWDGSQTEETFAAWRPEGDWRT